MTLYGKTDAGCAAGRPVELEDPTPMIPSLDGSDFPCGKGRPPPTRTLVDYVFGRRFVHNYPAANKMMRGAKR